MTARLPSSPSLKHLRLEAKNILKAHKARNVSCCGVLRNLHQFKEKPDEEILKADVSLVGVQFALAMEYGFPSWVDMKKHVNLPHGAAAIATGGVDYSTLSLKTSHLFSDESYSMTMQAASQVLLKLASYLRPEQLPVAMV